MESRFPSYRRALYLNYMSAATYNFEVSPALIHPELRVPWIKTRPDDQPIAGGQRPDVADISPHRPLSHFAPLVGRWCTDRGQSSVVEFSFEISSYLLIGLTESQSVTIAARDNGPLPSEAGPATCLIPQNAAFCSDRSVISTSQAHAGHVYHRS